MYTSSEGKRILYLSESAVTINKFQRLFKMYSV